MTYDGPWEEVEYGRQDEDYGDEVTPFVPAYDSNVHLPFAATCPECDFTSRDIKLLQNHSCDVQQNGGRCEDYPCCGHESGDCNGLLYGSDEAIQADYYRLARSGMDDVEIDHYYAEMERGY